MGSKPGVRGPKRQKTASRGPKKSLGQHWLKNRTILNEIADLAATPVTTSLDPAALEVLETPKSPESALEASVSPLCLEIGPGLGTLTSSLLKRFKRVIAVEFDPSLAKNLPNSFPGTSLKVINTDILDFDFSTLPTPYVVAGNIPYYITSPILKKLLLAPVPAQKIVLLIQKEVAERLVSRRATLLSLWVGNRADVSLGPVVPRAEFTPPPKVDSQVIVLEPHPPTIPEETFRLIERGFSSPRKKLSHNLAPMPLSLDSIGIPGDARPGDLSLMDWQRLNDSLSSMP